MMDDRPSNDAAALITLDMGARCTRCRTRGAGRNGLCLECTFKKFTEEANRMGARTKSPKADHDAEQAQPSLIPMSREELDEAAQDLAGKVAELEEMEADHADQRKTMRDTRNALMATIGAVASTIRSHGR